MSNTRRRGSDGKWIREEGDMGEDGVQGVVAIPVTPRVSRATSSRKSPPASFVKSALRIMISGKKDEDIEDYKEALKKDCSSIYRTSRIASRVAKFCHQISQYLKGLVAVYFVGNIFLQGMLYNLTSIILHCVFGRGQHFYTRISEVIFPPDMISRSPYMQIVVRESGMLSNSEPLAEISFPLSVNNPVIHLGVLALFVLNSYLMVCLQRMLIKVARLARDASPEEDFEHKHGQLPPPL